MSREFLRLNRSTYSYYNKTVKCVMALKWSTIFVNILRSLFCRHIIAFDVRGQIAVLKSNSNVQWPTLCQWNFITRTLGSAQCVFFTEYFDAPNNISGNIIESRNAEGVCLCCAMASRIFNFQCNTSDITTLSNRWWWNLIAVWAVLGKACSRTWKVWSAQHYRSEFLQDASSQEIFLESKMIRGWGWLLSATPI